MNLDEIYGEYGKPRGVKMTCYNPNCRHYNPKARELCADCTLEAIKVTKSKKKK